MQKTKATHLLITLPITAAVLALSGCGGDGDDNATSGGTIISCFSANSTVNYALSTVSSSMTAPSSTSSGNSTSANKSTVGPMTYNGQYVTGQTFSFPNTNVTTTTYWQVTRSGVTMLATVTGNGTAVTDGTVIPQNMQPGQAVSNSSNNITATFVGYETLTLAGKTFKNTCHFQESDNQGGQVDAWYASGYGSIQQTSSSGTTQYNGPVTATTSDTNNNNYGNGYGYGYGPGYGYGTNYDYGYYPPNYGTTGVNTSNTSN